MSKKPNIKKGKKAETALAPEESRELEMIIDRLQIQDPAGESLGNYLRSLHNTLLRRETLAAALVERLSKIPSEVGFRAFLALKDLLEDKSYRRVVKQAAYRFSQRGYLLDSPPPEDQTTVLIHKEARKPVAHLIPVEGAFRFFTALIYSDEGFSPVAVSALLQNHLHDLDVRVAESSQKLYKEFIRSTESHFSIKAYEIPIEHAARLFFEMTELAAIRMKGQETEQAKRLLQPFYHPDRLPYVYEIMPPLDDPERRLREIKKEELLDKMNLSPLVLPKESLAPYWERIQSVEQSVLVLPGEVKEERVNRTFHDAADQLCVGEVRSFYQRHFEEEALRFKVSGGDEELAMSAWIAAQHLRTGAKAGDNPIIVHIISELIYHYWQDEIAEAEKQPSEETVSTEDRFYRTESGLILPR